MPPEPSPQPAEDLERALAEIDAAAVNLHARQWLILKHWPAIRAALARERALREALREYGQHHYGCPGELAPEQCNCGLKALLAQPAAGEERERG